PGFKGITGSVEVTPDGGKLTLDSPGAQISIPKMFDVASFSFDKLSGQASWKLKDQFRVDVQRFEAANNDASLSGTAAYVANGTPLGYLKAHADVQRARVGSAWKYVPLIAGQETVNWLRYGLIGGQATQGTVDFVGNISDFPFKETPQHQFIAKANISGLTIDFYPIKFDDPSKTNKPGAIWPTVGDVGCVLTFEGDSMHVDLSKGSYGDVSLVNGTVDIPSFNDPTIWLRVDASATGGVSSFLEYVNTSPVKVYTSDIFGKAKGSGNGTLNLALSIPLDGEGDVHVDGKFAPNGASINFNQFQIPDLTNVTGDVFFSEKGAHSEELAAMTFGQPVTANFRTTDKGGFVIKASGRATNTALEQVIPVIMFKVMAKQFLTGSAPFTLNGTIVGDKVAFDITSSLEGLGSKLPAPLSKDAAAKMPLTFKLANSGNTSDIKLNISGLFDSEFVVKNGNVDKAAIGTKKMPSLPPTGNAIDVNTPEVKVSEWEKVFERLSPGTASKKTKSETIELPVLYSAYVHIDKLYIDGFDQTNLTLTGNTTKPGWEFKLTSDQLSGDLGWQRAANGKEAKLNIALSDLFIPESTGSFAEETKPVEVKGGWPAISAVINNLTYGKMRLGKVELHARNTISSKGHLWEIMKLAITNPDANLRASGSWQKGYAGENLTTFLIDQNISNLGGLLKRLDMGNVIRAGKGTIKGELSWDGTPLGFNYQTFDGKLDINMSKGEILKIEPGAGAKLLTLLSLQSLTRYLSLDFRDFYSKGFNFDTIIGNTTIGDGVMAIKDLTIVGSGATVVMKGSVNMQKETENLNILVLPDINATGASIALAIANPIAGLGSFLAQMIFKDPLSKMFSFEYSVTGTWSDPIVKKIEKKHTF
ncbi:MAG: TIGR02099 family protein, partial [Klebsiella quasipneumoniae]|nr:TIGR02099 family protein [Klebsiella quasipneumoniae]